MHIITDTPQYHSLQGDTNVQSEPSTCSSTSMNQGHYLTKLLVVFVKTLTDCKSFIDIRLSDCLSSNVKDRHPAFSLCLNWFKRHVPHVLKVRNCKVPQCALVSGYVSVGLRHAMTERFRICHFWTCFAMSKPKETMCRIRLWTNKDQTADSLEGNQNAFESLTSFIHRPVHQMNSLFLEGETLTGILHYPASIQQQIPCQSLQAVLFHVSPVIWGLKCYLPLAGKRVWMLSGLEKFVFDDKELWNSAVSCT